VNAPLFVLADAGLGAMVMLPVRCPTNDDVPPLLLLENCAESAPPPLEFELLPPELDEVLPLELLVETAAPPPPVSAVLC